MFNAIKPGALNTAQKIYAAENKAKGIFGQMTFKPIDVDFKDQLKWMAYRVQETTKGAPSIRKYQEQLKKGEINLKAYLEQVEKTAGPKIEIYKDLERYYKGALRIGMSPSEVMRAMKDGGVPEYILKQIYYNGKVKYINKPKLK